MASNSHIDFLAEFDRTMARLAERKREVDAAWDAVMARVRARTRAPEIEPQVCKMDEEKEVEVVEVVADADVVGLNDEYEVLRINGMRDLARGRQYRIVWKGWPASMASWKYEWELDDCQAAVFEYLSSRRRPRQ